MTEGEIITRRRKWSPAEKSALLDEVEAENGKVAVVARRHGISESLLYNWRSAWKAAARVESASETVDFVPLGIVGETSGERRPLLAPPKPARQPLAPASDGGTGTIEIALPNGVRICVGGLVITARSAYARRTRDSAFSFVRAEYPCKQVWSEDQQDQSNGTAEHGKLEGRLSHQWLHRFAG